ncbi:class I SAM-dependent methyltransferase [Bacillus sp. JCM 19034]|uniref:class I SAM-dependent methyltransferase n=1 Tax=Bacillus sp. JCM 19034 TaxID=1481928 RepID=UPI0007845AAA|nr:class I SAM-dependent methyltransferase [Bacillus sp. JCM 19034]
MNYIQLLKELSVNSAHPGGLRLTKKLIENEEISNDDIVLEVGCGIGSSASLLYGLTSCHLTVIDQDKEMIQKAQARFRQLKEPIMAIHSSVESLPFSNQTFDFILAESVLAFASNEAIRECFRVLKNGGRLLLHEMTLTDSLTNNEYRRLQQFYGFKQFNQKHEWTDILLNAGFVQIEEVKLGPIEEDDSSFLITDEIDQETWECLNEHIQLLKEFKHRMVSSVFRCWKE